MHPQGQRPRRRRHFPAPLKPQPHGLRARPTSSQCIAPHPWWGRDLLRELQPVHGALAGGGLVVRLPAADWDGLLAAAGRTAAAAGRRWAPCANAKAQSLLPRLATAAGWPVRSVQRLIAPAWMPTDRRREHDTQLSREDDQSIVALRIGARNCRGRDLLRHSATLNNPSRSPVAVPR